MRKRGFTLLELLVVITIIGILIALTMPALKGARDRANTVACGANLHGIGIGLRNYLDENARIMPDAADVPSLNNPPHPPLYLALASQIPMKTPTQPTKVWDCPSDNQGYLNTITGVTYPSWWVGEGLSYDYVAFRMGWIGKKIETGHFYALAGDQLTPLVEDFGSFHGPNGARVSKNVVYLDGHVSNLTDYSVLLGNPATLP